MNLLTVICTLCLLQVARSETPPARQENGYIITAPGRFIEGRPEQVCVEMFDISEAVDIRLTLEVTYREYSWRKLPEGVANHTADSTGIIITPQDPSKCSTLTFSREVQDDIWPTLFLIVEGRTRSGWSMQDSREVSALVSNRWSSTSVTFVQTDKPIYKPGQLVQFRVLTLDSRLRPLKEQIDEIYLEAPSNIRLEQWLNTDMESGMSQFKFQLLDEPEMGTYTIVMKKGEADVRTTFVVEEYVLPRYEVTITPPKYITMQAEYYTAEVCAKYTFGQPVQGDVEGSVCLKDSRREYVFNETTRRYDPKPMVPDVCVQIDQPLEDGCSTVTVSRTDLGWDRYTEWTWGVSINMEAQVKEKGTGEYLNATGTRLGFSQYDIKLTAEGPDKFKPGLPYRAKCLVQTLDDKPAPGKIIEVRISNWGGDSREQYSKNYTTDADGFIYFSIPPVVDKRHSLSITIKAIEYKSEFWSWNQPSAYLNANGWYSPSGSFLQIQEKKEELSCGSDATYHIQYTTSDEQNVQLFYKIAGVGDLAGSGSIPLSLTLSSPIEEPDEEEGWDVSETRYPCYWFWRCIPVPIILESEVDVANSDDTLAGSPGDVETTSTTTKAPSTDPEVVIATHKGSFELTIPVTAAMSPESHLVIYYVRDDGEVVADTIDIKVEQCLANEAEMKFSKEEARPGEDVGISFTASPNSLCGYGVVDKSVFLKGGNNQLTLAHAINQIRRYILYSWSAPWINENDKCGPLPPRTEVVIEGEIDGSPGSDGSDGPDGPFPVPFREERRIVTHYWWETPYQDGANGFRQGGLVVLTNLDLDTSPCILRSSTYTTGGIMFSGTGGSSTAPTTSTTAKTQALKDSMARNGGGGGEDEEETLESTIRTYFPETWLWNLIVINENGMANVDTKVPDTITQWIGNAVCLNDEDGLGVSPPATLTAFQPFFVSMNLPYSVIRTERLQIKLTVANYLNKCMAVRLTTEQSDGYTIGSKPSKDVCVCGRDTATELFNIIMTELGPVNVSISAEIISHPTLCGDQEMTTQVGISDRVIRPILVKPEGAPREYTVSDFLCFPEDGDVISKPYSLPLPGKNSLIDGSERGQLKVIGDVMGPALNNLDRLLQMPNGCAEQTMVSLAPNIFVLQYLEAIGKDTPEIREKAYRHMRQGYVKELGYAHNDQSYSSFGTSKPDEPGSMWLTAFVVKCFGLAQPYIFIDKTIMAASIQFFLTHQDKNGCFPLIGTTHSKYMQGGFGDDQDNKAALTAYVVIAMLESGVDPETRGLAEAMSCIDSQTYDDAYTTSIVAYAYTLYAPNDPRTAAVIDKLMDMAITENGLTHWKAREDEPVRPEGTWWWYRPNSAEVETTSYALMALLGTTQLRDDKITVGLPLVRWLSTQRNAYGGFGSTQDTVIGLQALAKFASLIYSDGVSADIEVESASGDSLAVFAITDENSLVEYREEMDEITDITVNARGKGCFLFQANVRYNIKETDSARQAFRTQVRAFRRKSAADSCNRRELRICTRYTGEGGVSNMAMVEVKMVSGWVADKSSLKELMKDEEVQLQKYEIDQDGTVQMYFNELDRHTKCFTFEITREFKVSNQKPAVVTTYDYYTPELRQETQYNVFPCMRSNVRQGQLNVVRF